MSVQATTPTNGPSQQDDHQTVSLLTPDNRKDETPTSFILESPSPIPDFAEVSTFMSHSRDNGLPLDQSREIIPRLPPHHGVLNKSNNNESADSSSPEADVQNNTSTLVLERLKSIADKVDRSTDHILVKQYDLEHQQQTSNQCLKFLSQSIKDLIEGAKLVGSPADLDIWLAKFANGDSQLDRDYDAFMRQTNHITALRSQIIDLESQLKKQTGRLSKHLDLPGTRIEFEDSRASQTALQQIASTVISRDTSRRPETPPLLAQYYDRKGDVGIYRERLQELEYQFQDEIGIRNAVEERGDLLDISDEEFHHDFLNKRDTILDELSKAEHDAQILAERCRDEGIQIKERRRDSSDAVSSHSDFPLRQENLNIFPALKKPASLSSSSSNQIRKWLDTVSPDDSCAANHPIPKIDAAFNESTRPTAFGVCSPLRRAASFPQYLATNRTTRLSISRSHMYGDLDPQQEEATEFELVTNWADRDARSLPEGTKEVSTQQTDSRLIKMLHWNPFNLGSLRSYLLGKYEHSK